jgi:spoIIIJ-associated protein
MKEVVYAGIDIDEALIKASEDLKLTADNIEFEIMTLGSKGLFGIGRKPAKIKVFLKQEKERPFKKDKKSKDDFKKKKKDRPERPKRKERPERPKKKEDRQERPKKKEGGPEKKEIIVDREPSPENVKKIEEFVLFVAKQLDDDITVSADEINNKITVIITTDNTGKIIGKGGRIINSLEYLTIRFARKLYDARVRVVIQIEGERKAR